MREHDFPFIGIRTNRLRRAPRLPARTTLTFLSVNRDSDRGAHGSGETRKNPDTILREIRFSIFFFFFPIATRVTFLSLLEQRGESANH